MEDKSYVLIEDLEKYIRKLGFSLTFASKKIFIDIEKVAIEYNCNPSHSHILISLIDNIQIFMNIIIKHNNGKCNIRKLLVDDIIKSLEFEEDYDITHDLYSKVERRELSMRGRLLDLTLSITSKNNRKQIFDLDILEGMFLLHEEIYPIYDNANWTDEKLHTNYITLSHMIGRFHNELDIKLDEILSKLGLITDISIKNSPLEYAPSNLRPYLMNLFQDHPNYDKNCFLIMPFGNTKLHNDIVSHIKLYMKKQGFKVIRADDRNYSDDLWTNVQTYIYGSNIAIALFERILDESFNPNVSYEVGYMHALDKKVCLLKDKTLPSLYTDLIGKLYQKFDVQDLSTIDNALENWLKDKRLI